MSNTLLTPTIIANELLMRFKNNLAFAKTVSHEYDDKFDKIGDTYNLRNAAQFTANKTADITSAIQDVKEDKTPLVINTQANVPFQFSSKDLTLTVDRFAERYLDGAALALSNAFEVDGLTVAYQGTPNLVGTPGTTPATAQVVLSAGTALDNNSAPVDGDRYLVCNSAAQASMVDALKGILSPGEAIGKQYRKGRMGAALGFDWGMSQNVRYHTPGTWGTTPQVDGATQTGSTLNVKGLTTSTGTVKAGDVITLALVYATNIVSGDILGTTLRQFTVLADATADSDGKAALTIYPPIKTAAPGRTCSVSPADSANITVTGTAAYPQNLAYHKHAFTYAMVPLEVPQGVHFAKTAVDKDSGLSIRMVSAYNILTDIFVTRCDVMYGWAVRRGAWSCRIAG